MPDVRRLGDQLPRLSNVPQGVKSDGPDAVELAALCGLFLDPWQRHILNGLFQRSESGHFVTENGLVIVPRQNGKGALDEAWELARLFLFGERKVVHTAHLDKTIKDAFDKMVDRIQAAPLLQDRLMADRSKGIRVANGQRSFTFKTGQQLIYGTRTQSAFRGNTLDAVVIDEVQELEDLELDALSSTIMTKPFGQILMTGSAPIPGKSEVLRRLVGRGRAGDPALTYFEWSVDETLPADLDDPELWAQANPGFGYRLFEPKFRADRARQTDDGFAREHLGIVEVEDSNPFTVAWDGLYDADSEITGPATYALEVAQDRSWACIAAAGVGPLGMHVEYGAYEPGTAWIVPWLKDLAARKSIRVVVQPSTEAGALIWPLEQARVTTLRATPQDYAQACGQLYDAVVDSRTVRHSSQPALDFAVGAAKRRRSGEAWVWDRRHPDRDISPLAAVTLAFWGANRKKRPSAFHFS